MPKHGTNLFTRLWSYSNRQTENFTTESLCWILDVVQKFEPCYFRTLILFLCGPLIEPFLDSGQVEIRSQTHKSVNGEQSYTDIELEWPECLVIIEVKTGAGLSGSDQIPKYNRRAADHKTGTSNFVVLLSDCPIEHAEVAAKPDYELLWRDLGAKLQGACTDVEDPRTKFMLQQFVSHLEERKMIAKRVSDKLTQGLTDLENLLGMVELAMRNLKVQHARSTSLPGRYLGYKLADEEFGDGSFWVGVYLPKPERLRFLTEKVFKVDAEMAQRLLATDANSGELYEFERGQFRSYLAFDQFCSKDLAEQQFAVGEFVDRSLKRAKSMRGKSST